MTVALESRYFNATNGGFGDNKTAATITVSTINADDLIVLFVLSGGFWGNGRAVSGVSDTAGLTWTREYQDTSSVSAEQVEIWWAAAPSVLTNDVITVAITSPGNSANNIRAFVYSGADTTTPFDNTPAADYSMTSPALSFSTLNTDTIVTAIWFSQSSPAWETTGVNSPLTDWDSQTSSEGSGWHFNSYSGSYVASSVQSGVSLSFSGQTGSSGDNRYMLAYAIKAAGGALPDYDLAAAIADDAGLSAALTVQSSVELAVALADDAGLTGALTVANPVNIEAAFVDESVFSNQMQVQLLVPVQSFVIVTGR